MNNHEGYLHRLLRLGFLLHFETALYNVAMTFIVRFMGKLLDGMNVTARSYAMGILFSYCVGAALAQANAIMTGWRIGARSMRNATGVHGSCDTDSSCNSNVLFCDIAMTGRFIVHIFDDTW